MITGRICVWLCLPLFVVGVQIACAQQVPVAPVQSDQQVGEMYGRIANNFARLRPMFDQVRAADWVAKGASETYITQVDSLRLQVVAVQREMDLLSRTSSRLDTSIRALFRAQNCHRSLDSLMAGLRRYQNPSLADLIQAVAAEDNDDLAKLQEYILELAGQKEQEYLIVEKEAQRCRGMISVQPPTPPKPVRRAP